MPRGTDAEPSLLVGADRFLGELLSTHFGTRLSPETPALRARDLLLETPIGAAPVVDEHSRPVGMLTASDLLRAERLEDATVDDLMTPFVFSLPARASLGQAAALMAYEGVHQCVVVDDAGHFAGVVTAMDVARWMGRAAGYVGLLGEPRAAIAGTDEPEDDLESPHTPALADLYYAQL
jgi:CBS domain-containing protein